ncbi:hypothetical protein AVHM3334_13265 [Acidovorax sp. SUPP3334]|nr:hypothetical protein AVHM3334_13265 [Acidovorax sp. SUPP3334]
MDRVEDGSRLVTEAGATMNEIVGSVRRVSDIISEITAASSEQSDNIGQISQSVSQLDQMTQQNAALVEQSTAASESLRDQANQLTQAVSQFKLSDADAVRPLATGEGVSASVARTRAVPAVKQASALQLR